MSKWGWLMTLAALLPAAAPAQSAHLRAKPEQVARLVLSADSSRDWHTLLKLAHPDALREFLKVDILYRDCPTWRAAALLEAGKVYEQLAQWSDAAENYARLCAKFPGDPSAAQARPRLDGAYPGANHSGVRRGRRIFGQYHPLLSWPGRGYIALQQPGAANCTGT